MARTGTGKAREALKTALRRPPATGKAKTTRKTRRSLRGLPMNAPALIQSLQTILEARAERIPDTRITMAARKLTAGLSSRRERGDGQDDPNDQQRPTRRRASRQMSDHDPGGDPGGNTAPEGQGPERRWLGLAVQ